MAPPKKRSVRHALLVLNIDDVGVFEKAGGDRDQEFKIVKKAYTAKALLTHPDKGGDAAEFRELQTTFEMLRDLYQGKKIDLFSESMVDSSSEGTKEYQFDASGDGSNDFGFASWEYYQEADDVPVPIYRMEPAKSGRSKCAKCKAKKMKDESGRRVPAVPQNEQTIESGEIRIGSIDEDSGVPMRVWLGLPDPSNCQDPKIFDSAMNSMSEVLLSGYGELDEDIRAAVIKHVMERSNWARPSKHKYPIARPDEKPAARSSPPGSFDPRNEAQGSAKSSSLTKSEGSLAKEKFVIPKPGTGLCVAGSLAGKRFCLTGIFPELGGGKGLNLGKDRAKVMIESFGGRVTSCVSGKTDVLLVGKEPGAGKLSKARALGTKLMSTGQLKHGLESGARKLESFPDDGKPLAIGKLSTGYHGNGIGRIMAPEEMDLPKKKAPVAIDTNPAASNRKPPPPTATAAAAKSGSNEDAKVFDGARFSVTGAFPELGGGKGATLGHVRATELIETHGGKVTSCVSGLTNVLLVGNDASNTKLSQAREKGTTLMSLSQLLQGLEWGVKLEEFPENVENAAVSQVLALPSSEDVEQTKGKGKRPLETKEASFGKRSTRSRRN